MENNIQVGQELVYVRNQMHHSGKVDPQIVRVDRKSVV